MGLPPEELPHDDTLAGLNDQFSTRCAGLAASLNSIQLRSKADAARLHEAEQAAARLEGEQELSSMREALLQQQVYRLEAALESSRLEASLASSQTYKLQQQLAEERQRSERMRAQRDSMAAQRDDAVLELVTVCADLDAMQATLSDSAVYVRYLRKKVLELEVQTTRQAAQSALQRAGEQQGDQGVFSLSSIKAAVQRAVDDARACEDADQRKRMIRQLQLRWHPDKNPVLAELATEVTKLINEATAQAGL